MPKRPVDVACDFAGTFNNGWTGAQPAWTFTPDSLHCHNGENHITWTLTTANVPAGFTAAFSNPGVAFKGTPPWVGTAPQNQADGSVAASDNFHGQAQAVKFHYNTNVTLTPNPGTKFPPQTFTHDPDVENDGGTK